MTHHHAAPDTIKYTYVCRSIWLKMWIFSRNNDTLKVNFCCGKWLAVFLCWKEPPWGRVDWGRREIRVLVKCGKKVPREKRFWWFLQWGLWVQGIRCCQALLLFQLGQLVQACHQYQGGPETRVYLMFTQHRISPPQACDAATGWNRIIFWLYRASCIKCQ